MMVRLLFCILCFCATFIHGDNNQLPISNAYSSYFFSPLTALSSLSSSSSAPRSGHSMVSCHDGAHILGGGNEDGIFYNDIITLRYNEKEGGEQWNATTTTAPWPARTEFGAIALPDGIVVVTSGVSGTSPYTYYDDLWINLQCVDSSHWQQLPKTTFPSRHAFGFVYFQYSIVVLGGLASTSAGNKQYSSVYSLAYNETSRTFAEEWISHGNAQWEGRHSFSAVVYAESLFIFGGYCNGVISGYQNDVWSLPSLGGTWSQLSADGSSGQFGGRSGGVAAVWQKQIIYATGTDGSYHFQNVWSYSSSTRQWQLLNATEVVLARSKAAMVNHQGRLIMSGGSSVAFRNVGTTNVALDDIWISSYESIIPTYFFNPPSPPLRGRYRPRWTHSMVSCDGSAHVLGGYGFLSALNDVVTLAYNPDKGVEQWKTTTLAASWHARTHFGAVALPDGTVVVTGGAWESSRTEERIAFNDVWINPHCVTPGHWQQLPNATFAGRSSFGLVYFEGSIVVLGGLLLWSDALSEVHSLAYNESSHTFASQWTNHGSAPWVARYSPAAVVFNGCIFLFSGYALDSNQLDSYLNDVWSLPSLSGEWIQLSAPSSPGRFSPRSGGVAAVWKNQIIFATGRDRTGWVQDIWSYSSVTQQWRLVDAHSLISNRSDAAMVNHRGRLILTGGSVEYLSHRDVWVSEYDDVSLIPSFSSVSSRIDGSNGPSYLFTSLPPGPLLNYTSRFGHAMISCGNRLHILGGAGSDRITRNDVVTLKYYPSETTTTTVAPWSGRYNFGAVALPDGTVVVTGGSGLRPSWSVFNDVWMNRQCVDEDQWQLVQSDTGFKARHAFGFVYIQGAIVVLGGVASSYYSSEVYSLEYDEKERTFMSNWTQHGSAPWPARSFPTAIVFAGSIFVIGGYNYDMLNFCMNDVWSLSSLSGTWIQLPLGPFSGRYGGVAAVWRGRIIYTTGSSFDEDVDDVWFYSNVTQQWLRINYTYPVMVARRQAAMVNHQGRLILTGGKNDSAFGLGDVWISDEDSLSTDISTLKSSRSRDTGENIPNITDPLSPVTSTIVFNELKPFFFDSYAPRSGHSMVSCHGSVHLLGGKSNLISSNDVVTLRYQEAAPDLLVDEMITTTFAPWPSRNRFGALVLPDGTLVITGGLHNRLTPLNDLWINSQCVDSDHWQQLPNTPFSPRYSFGFVYFQGSIVVVGGWIHRPVNRFSSEIFSLAYNETTRTFASNWIQHGSAPWIARAPSAAVYAGSIFVFGGRNYTSRTNQLMNDVWSLPSLGGEWIQLSSQLSIGRFTPRYYGVTAVWRNQIIYATGDDDRGKVQDIWSYSDVTQQWQLLHSTSLMPNRSYAAIVNHEGRLLITGGVDNSNYHALSDIWISEHEHERGSAISSPSSSSTSSSSFSYASSASSLLSSMSGTDINNDTIVEYA